ncbi:MAG: DUF402 domain-containing protein [Lachnospiraceae bacterium]|nr:DUF402 domain-containing protein [Lachnospiraceae bacterium]
MNELKLYRKRLIPNECILLKDDVIMHHSADILVTTWKTLNPKTAFSHGCSCYFFKEGFKVSKFFRSDGTLLYYYCDIVEFDVNVDENSLLVTDLLADVVIYPNGSHKVLDLDELADAYEQELITASQLTRSLHQLNHLLSIVQSGEFHTLLTKMDTFL